VCRPLYLPWQDWVGGGGSRMELLLQSGQPCALIGLGLPPPAPTPQSAHTEGSVGQGQHGLHLSWKSTREDEETKHTMEGNWPIDKSTGWMYRIPCSNETHCWARAWGDSPSLDSCPILWDVQSNFITLEGDFQSCFLSSKVFVMLHHNLCCKSCSFA